MEVPMTSSEVHELRYRGRSSEYKQWRTSTRNLLRKADSAR